MLSFFHVDTWLFQSCLLKQLLFLIEFVAGSSFYHSHFAKQEPGSEGINSLSKVPVVVPGSKACALNHCPRASSDPTSETHSQEQTCHAMFSSWHEENRPPRWSYHCQHIGGPTLQLPGLHLKWIPGTLLWRLPHSPGQAEGRSGQQELCIRSLWNDPFNFHLSTCSLGIYQPDLNLKPSSSV